MPKRKLKIKTSSDDSVDLDQFYAVSFTNGNLKADKFGEVKIEMLENTKDADKCRMVVTAGDSDYVGDFNMAKRDSGQFIGIEDPETDEFTLIPLKRVRVRSAISMSTSVDEEERKPKLQGKAMYDRLVQTFGGAKEKQSVMLRLKHGIDDDMIVEKFSSADYSNVNTNTHKLDRNTADDDAVIPPHDTETDDVTQCYPIDGYLPPSILQELQEFSAGVERFNKETLKSYKETNRYSTFILTQLSQLPLDAEERQKSYSLVVYLNALLYVYKTKPQDLSKKEFMVPEDDADLVNLPENCTAYILNQFTSLSKNKRMINRREKDKLLVHIILLALHITQHSFSVDSFLPGSRIALKKLQDVATSLGCTFRKVSAGSADQQLIIELKAPLKFPQTRAFSRKRRT